MDLLQSLNIPNLSYEVSRATDPSVITLIFLRFREGNFTPPTQKELDEYFQGRTANVLSFISNPSSEFTQTLKFLAELTDYIEDQGNTIDSIYLEKLKDVLMTLAAIQSYCLTCIADREHHLQKGVHIGNYFMGIRTRLISYLRLGAINGWFELVETRRLLSLVELFCASDQVLKKEEFLELEHALDVRVTAGDEITDILDEMSELLVGLADRYLAS